MLYAAMELLNSAQGTCAQLFLLFFILFCFFSFFSGALRAAALFGTGGPERPGGVRPRGGPGSVVDDSAPTMWACRVVERVRVCAVRVPCATLPAVTPHQGL